MADVHDTAFSMRFVLVETAAGIQGTATAMPTIRRTAFGARRAAHGPRRSTEYSPFPITHVPFAMCHLPSGP